MLTLGAQSLTLADLEAASEPVKVVVPGPTRTRLQNCRDYVTALANTDRPVYGSTTGFGPMVVFSGREAPEEQLDNCLAHLSAGQGPDLPLEVVRAAMLVRAHSLCQGRSGVSPQGVDALVGALGTSFTPAVPRFGSLGASGDLIPLAAVASALQGRSHAAAYVDGHRMPADEALQRAGLEPMQLIDGRDGLGMVNGTSVTVAAAGLALASLRRSRKVAVMLSGLLADILGAADTFTDARLLEAYGHAGPQIVGREMRALLAALEPSGKRNLQEPYSVRCVPHLVGACEDSLAHAQQIIDTDLQSVSDNPLFFDEDDHVAHGGNFFGQPVAFASDLCTIAATQLANLAERQLDLLMDPNRNTGLNPMLASKPGRQHGIQGVQLAATSITADMRRTSTPASMQSLPTNWHNQDVIPFGTQAALNSLEHAESLRLLHGSLGVALRQAVHVGGREPTAPVCAAVLAELTKAIAPIDPDRPLSNDVRRAADTLDETIDRIPARVAP
ncbi:HAL/PAL/TAL family ammonia-lyase [Saccharopolyspora sp. MS10]|uniref:HAL/PAL/TAL family ammonia-lyase n=1 Tax=Saccharopolyspora sp. MS10 TaxID=3385973 RepID=UPI0039A20E35